MSPAEDLPDAWIRLAAARSRLASRARARFRRRLLNGLLVAVGLAVLGLVFYLKFEKNLF